MLKPTNKSSSEKVQRERFRDATTPSEDAQPYLENGRQAKTPPFHFEQQPSPIEDSEPSSDDDQENAYIQDYKVGKREILLKGSRLNLKTRKKSSEIEVIFKPAPGKTWKDYGDITSLISFTNEHIKNSTRIMEENEVPLIYKHAQTGERTCFVCIVFEKCFKLKIVKCSVCGAKSEDENADESSSDTEDSEEASLPIVATSHSGAVQAKESAPIDVPAFLKAVEKNPIDVPAFIKAVGKNPFCFVGSALNKKTFKSSDLAVVVEPLAGKTLNDYDLGNFLEVAEEHMKISAVLREADELPVIFSQTTGETVCSVCTFFVFHKFKVLKCNLCKNPSNLL